MMFRWLLVLTLAVIGCATPRVSHTATSHQPFEFSRDTFAFPNELLWSYEFDAATGTMRTQKREPEPEFVLRCFAVTRAVRQFHDCAIFHPGEPRLDAQAYRKLVRRILKCDPRAPPGHHDPIAVPGYSDLREFSSHYESLLKRELGGAWRSYFQRGNWRMVFPFSRRHQDRTAEQMLVSLREGRLPIVHLVRFPRITINHGLLVYNASENGETIRFTAYDPNDAASPVRLDFDRVSRTFYFPANSYFVGGRVNVYEIYRGWVY